jgi:hypothetical protein
MKILKIKGKEVTWESYIKLPTDGTVFGLFMYFFVPRYYLSIHLSGIYTFLFSM